MKKCDDIEEVIQNDEISEEEKEIEDDFLDDFDTLEFGDDK